MTSSAGTDVHLFLQQNVLFPPALHEGCILTVFTSTASPFLGSSHTSECGIESPGFIFFSSFTADGAHACVYLLAICFILAEIPLKQLTCFQSGIYIFVAVL
jgi:hypothetical protein